jgi:hypothetical protein
MRTLLPLVFFIGIHFSLQAQQPIIKRYRTGEIASRETPEPWPGTYNDRFRSEKVEIFNCKGDLVYEGYRRDFAGHSSVHLNYHPNGGVSRIDVSSAPDAGIQWYKSRMTLDEDGNITDRSEQSHDMMTTTPYIHMVEPIDVPKPVAITCAVPMETRIIILNRSSKAITVRLKGKQGQESGKEYVEKLEPGDSLVPPSMVSAETFLRPEEMYEFHIIAAASKRSVSMEFSRIPMRQMDSDRQHRRVEFFLVDDL